MLSENIFKDTIVLELASVLAGPSVGQFFAELGATVIKVENHKAGGDVTRSWRRPGEKNEISAYFSSVNWGKKSVGIDLSTPEGQEIVHEMVKKCSIVIASFRPGAAEKLEMDYNTLRQFNPKLIYGSITGYGTDSDRVGYDAIIQAESGFMYLNGTENEPRKIPVALMDLLAGHQLKQSLLLAWIERMRSGSGCEVSVSLMDTALSSLANQAANFLVGGKDPVPSGSLHPNIAPYGEVIETRDQRKIVLAIGSDQQFQRLCEVLGVPETAADPSYSSNSERIKNREALLDELKAAAAQVTSEFLLTKARSLHIPLGEIQTVGDAISKSAGRLNLNNGELTGIRTFPPVSSGDLSVPPRLGQHTHECLSSLIGLDPDEYDNLRNRNILA